MASQDREMEVRQQLVAAQEVFQAVSAVGLHEGWGVARQLSGPRHARSIVCRRGRRKTVVKAPARAVPCPHAQMDREVAGLHQQQSASAARLRASRRDCDEAVVGLQSAIDMLQALSRQQPHAAHASRMLKQVRGSSHPSPCTRAEHALGGARHRRHSLMRQPSSCAWPWLPNRRATPAWRRTWRPSTSTCMRWTRPPPPLPCPTSRPAPAAPPR